jgi:hypothetical protein
MDEQSVTLVMCAWNPRPEWLASAVESALASSADGELILVDDGSDTQVETLVPPRPRLRFLRIEHGGLPAARNAGLAATRGTYVRFVDADDVFGAESTDRLVRAAAGATDVIPYGDTIVCDGELAPVAVLEPSAPEATPLDCLLGRFECRITSMVFSRAVAERVGPFEPALPVCNDWDFVLRALEFARPVRVDVPGTYYRRHPRSLTGDASVEAGEREWRTILERYLDRHPATDAAVERRVRAAMALRRARAAAHEGSAWQCARELRRAFGYSPTDTVSRLAALGRKRLRSWRRADGALDPRLAE